MYIKICHLCLCTGVGLINWDINGQDEVYFHSVVDSHLGYVLQCLETVTGAIHHTSSSVVVLY